MLQHTRPNESNDMEPHSKYLKPVDVENAIKGLLYLLQVLASIDRSNRLKNLQSRLGSK